MKNSLKFFFFILLAFFLGIAAILFIIKEKLNPDSFVQVLTRQIEKNFPESKVNFRKKTYFLGLDFVIELEDLSLTQKKIPLLTARKLEMRLPIWAFFVDSSRIKLGLEQVKIYKKDAVINSSDKLFKAIRFELPGSLSTSHVTLKIKDFSLINFESDTEFFKAEKLLLRDFNLKKKSSFELVLPIKKSDKFFNEENHVWIFGEMKPNQTNWNINFWGELKSLDPGDDTLDAITFNGTSLLESKSLDLKSELVFFLNKKKLGLGNIFVGNDNFTLHFEFADFPMGRFDNFRFLVGNNHLPELVSLGKINFDFLKKEKDSSATIQGEIEFPGDFLLAPEAELYPGKWRVLVKNNKLESSFINPKGDISFFKRSVLNPDTFKVEQFSEEIGYSNLDLANSLFGIKSIFHLISSSPEDYFSTSYSLKNLKFNNLSYDGFLRFGSVPGSKFYSLQLDDKSSSLKINYQKNTNLNKLEFFSKNFSWDSKRNFMSPVFMADQGLLNGRVIGEWGEDYLQGNWDIKINSSQLLSPSGSWINVLAKIWNIFEIDPSIYPNQNWHFSLRAGLIKIKSLTLDGIRPVQIRGDLNLNNTGKSFLELKPLKGNTFKPVIKPILNFKVEEKNGI